MQAIIIKRLPFTDTKPARLKASCARGSITRTCQFEGDEDEVKKTILALLAKFAKEDLEKYNTPLTENPWVSGIWSIGSLQNGNFVAVKNLFQGGLWQVNKFEILREVSSSKNS